MNALRSYVLTQLKEKPEPLFTSAVLVIVHYRFPAPPSYPRWKKRKLHLTHHSKKPDADNCQKFFQDSLSGYVWDDDCKISWLLISKSITEEDVGSTTFFVAELSDGKIDYSEILGYINDNIAIDDTEPRETNLCA